MSSGTTTKFHMPQPLVKQDAHKEHQSATVGSTTGGGTVGTSSGSSSNLVKVYQNQVQYIVAKTSTTTTSSAINSDNNGTAAGAVKNSSTPADYVSSSGTTEMADTEVKVVIKQTASGVDQDSIDQQEQSIIAALYQQQQPAKNGNNRLSSQRSSPVSSPSPPPATMATANLKLSNGASAAAAKMSAPVAVTTPAAAPTVTAATGNNSSPNTANFHNFIGRLISKDNMLLISEDIIEVGRNSSKSQVDFHVGKNSFVSRKHFIIQHDMNDDFNLFCLSKNGVFIDNVFHRKCPEPYKLPKVCSIRFPSTNIKIQFENLIDQANNGGISIDLNQHTPATFMATATSMPEFFTNTISTLVVDSDMGLGTILGSMLFNTLGVAALVGLLTKSHVKLDWWPLTRDSVILIISTSSLVSCLWDERVYWYESVVFVVLYVLYFIVMFQNDRMKHLAVSLIEDRWNLCRRLEKKPSDEPISEHKNHRKYSIAVLGEAINTTLQIPTSDKQVPRVSCDSSTESDDSDNSRMRLLKISEKSWFGIAWWLYTWPFRVIIRWTIPDPRVYRKLYPLTFLMCIAWIGGTAYMVFWMMSIIGSTFDVPETVMGLTFLAFGGCMPEAVSAVTVIRKGNGAMGVSNSLGANSLAILFSLGLPWFIRNMMEGGATTGAYIEINSYGMQYSVLALFLAVGILYLVLYLAKYTLRKLVGLALLIAYLVIVTFMILVELDVFFPSKNIC